MRIKNEAIPGHLYTIASSYAVSIVLAATIILGGFAHTAGTLLTLLAVCLGVPALLLVTIVITGLVFTHVSVRNAVLLRASYSVIHIALAYGYYKLLV